METKTLERAKPKQARAQVLDEKLLDAVQDMLDEGVNFDRMTVDDICGRAGCTKGAFYSRYESKVAILLDLYTSRISGQVIQSHADALDLEWCRGASIREIVDRHFMCVMNSFTRYRVVTMLVGREIRFGNPSEEVVRENRQMAQRTTDYFIARIMEHRDEIKHPDVMGAIDLAMMCTSLCIRERAYAQHNANKTFLLEQADDEQRFLSSLVDAFLRILMVDEEVIAQKGGQ